MTIDNGQKDSETRPATPSVDYDILMANSIELYQKRKGNLGWSLGDGYAPSWNGVWDTALEIYEV